MSTDILAFAFDNDDFFTRAPGSHNIYHQAAHKAFHEQYDGTIAYEPWMRWQTEIYEAGACMFTAAAAKYGCCRDTLFQRFHELVDTAQIEHDTESTAALTALQDRAVIFTDAALSWTQARNAQSGFSLKILSRDQGNFNRKAQAPERFEQMRQTLSQMLGQDLKPQNILFGDDSASALRVARQLGYRTLHGHWGYPGRAHTDEFDFNADHVGTFLVQHGFVAA